MGAFSRSYCYYGNLLCYKINRNLFPDDWAVCWYHDVGVNKYRVVIMTHQTLSLEQYLKLFSSTLIKNILLDSHQSGFRSLHSTVTAFLDLTNQWRFNIDRGLVSGILFLDLKRAFDTVDHQLVLTKLEYIGICGSLGIV